MFRKLAFVCLVLALLLAACQTPAALAPTATSIPPPPTLPPPTVVPQPPTRTPFPESFTNLETVNGNQMFITCKGISSPTIILENGPSMQSWKDPIYSSISRTCAYTHAGIIGAVSGPRTTLEQVKDLHQLLTQVGVPGPYILVGHLTGGFNILLYTETYPQEVVGLVCVHCRSPFMEAILIEKLKVFPAKDAEQKKTIDQMIAAMERTSVPESEWSLNSEKLDVQASLAQVKKITSLGSRPLVVLVARTFAGSTGDFSQTSMDGWVEASQKLSQISTQGRFERVEGETQVTIVSSAAVAKAIQEVVDKVKK